MTGSLVATLLGGLLTGLAGGIVAILIFAELVAYAGLIGSGPELLSNGADPVQLEWVSPFGKNYVRR